MVIGHVLKRKFAEVRALTETLRQLEQRTVGGPSQDEYDRLVRECIAPLRELLDCLQLVAAPLLLVKSKAHSRAWVEMGLGPALSADHDVLASHEILEEILHNAQSLVGCLCSMTMPTDPEWLHNCIGQILDVFYDDQTVSAVTIAPLYDVHRSRDQEYVRLAYYDRMYVSLTKFLRYQLATAHDMEPAAFDDDEYSRFMTAYGNIKHKSLVFIHRMPWYSRYLPHCASVLIHELAHHLCITKCLGQEQAPDTLPETRSIGSADAGAQAVMRPVATSRSEERRNAEPISAAGALAPLIRHHLRALANSWWKDRMGIVEAKRAQNIALFEWEELFARIMEGNHPRRMLVERIVRQLEEVFCDLFAVWGFGVTPFLTFCDRPPVIKASSDPLGLLRDPQGQGQSDYGLTWEECRELFYPGEDHPPKFLRALVMGKECAADYQAAANFVGISQRCFECSYDSLELEVALVIARHLLPVDSLRLDDPAMKGHQHARIVLHGVVDNIAAIRGLVAGVYQAEFQQQARLNPQLAFDIEARFEDGKPAAELLEDPGCDAYAHLFLVSYKLHKDLFFISSDSEPMTAAERSAALEKYRHGISAAQTTFVELGDVRSRYSPGACSSTTTYLGD